MNNSVKEFVDNVLGCGCPEEVFSSIKVEKTPGRIGGVEAAFTIRIGGRLMVIGVPGECIMSQEGSLADVVAEGIRLRDNEGFNRLRIVVVSDDTNCETKLRNAFASISGIDELVHIHVAAKGLVEVMLDERESGGKGESIMGELITKPTVWHEMEGPFIGGREHYQEKSYGWVEPLKEEQAESETPGVEGDGEALDR